MSTNKKNRKNEEQQLKAGTVIHLKTGLHILGEQLTQRQLVVTLDKRDAATSDVEAKRAAYLQAVAAERSVMEETDPVVSAMRAAVHVMYRGKREVLADFGLAPRRDASTRTLDEKKEARDKALATREARHTMSKKQRGKIHGEPTAPPPEPKPIAAPAPIVVTAPIVVPDMPAAPAGVVNGAGSH